MNISLIPSTESFILILLVFCLLYEVYMIFLIPVKVGQTKVSRKNQRSMEKEEEERELKNIFRQQEHYLVKVRFLLKKMR